MMKRNKKTIVLFLFLITVILINSCSGQAQTQGNKNAGVSEKGKPAYKVTFIELGSVRCIPCQQMQPIMKSIREKYAGQVNVVFYDVWTEAGAPYARKYGIQAIPTQVFLDENGKEYFRHVGFFPEEELIKVLQQKGVK
jgi:thioredoxin 1